MPPLPSSLAPLLFSVEPRPRSPSNPNPPPPLVPPPSSVLAADSPAPVSAAAIPRLGSSLAPSSSDFDPHPALSPFLQGRRRAPPPAAASARRAAPSPPLLARITAGEARLLLLFPVRAAPGPLRPCLAAPARAAVAVRAHRASPATPWPRPRRGQGACPALTRLGGPLARGPRLSAPGLAGWGCT